jgi:hypothetical protein
MIAASKTITIVNVITSPANDCGKIPLMADSLQGYVKEILDKLEILPEVPEGSIEAEFRELVKLLCLTLKNNPPDESNTSFVPPNPFTN